MILKRLDSPSDRTNGILTLPDGTEYKSLERPWLDNKPWVSCVPAGFYFFVRDTHGRFQWFRLLDVLNRTDIELHLGKSPEDSAGCILLPLDCLKAMRDFFFSELDLTYVLEIRNP